MREYIASAWVLVAGMVIAGAIVAAPAFTLSLSKALAQEGSAVNIQFPVAELGNCGSEGECKTYCDDPANITACAAFAEANGLMSREEAATARKFSQGNFEGPGGCTSKESCESYCDDIAHINVCVAFAEANNIIPPQELAEAKKVQAAIARGVKPPACGNKRSCDTYCRAPANMKECIAFGEAAGFIQGRELEDARKMIAALDKGVTPPACNGKEECDVFCAEEANFPQCIAFAEAAGFMSKEELEMAKKTGGKGPGGCRGEECRTFCDNPANQEVCFSFAKEHGLLKQEDLQRMEEGKTKFREGLSQAPPEVAECLKNTVGQEVLDKLASGGGMPPQDLGEKMRACFENFRPQGNFEGGRPERSFPGQPSEEGFSGMVPPGGTFQGPGGCVGPEECRSYCESNPEACRGFGGGEGRIEELPRPGEVPHFNQIPEGMMEGRGGFPGAPSGEQFRQGYGEEFQKQFEGQYREEYQKQYQQTIPEGTYPMPPTGAEMPIPSGPISNGGVYPTSPMMPYPSPNPDGSSYPMPPQGGAYPMPPEGSVYQQYQGGMTAPPSGGSFMPPPEFQNTPPPTEPPPPSSLGPQALLGLFLEIFR